MAGSEMVDLGAWGWNCSLCCQSRQGSRWGHRRRRHLHIGMNHFHLVPEGSVGSEVLGAWETVGSEVLGAWESRVWG